jgi:N6-L-threonylcarbamoyladenine synthase
MPKLLADSTDYDFSYSGLKTALVIFCKKNPDYNVDETAYSFQERALELLVRKSLLAAEKNDIGRIAAAGGVTANKRLREIFKEKAGGIDVIIPSPVLCTDNAAMTAGLAYHYYKSGKFSSLETDVSPRE